MSIYQFKPTYLYIKQHSITGKLYFGKTVQNPEKYIGSGSRWVNHIKKHGTEHVVNLWYCLFYEQEDCTNFAMSFSENNNIIESTDWLNLMNENGLDGGTPGYKLSEEHKHKLSINKLGKPLSESHKHKLSLSQLGREKPKTEEHKKKLSESQKGKTKSTTHKSKISKTLTGRAKAKVKCPHCNKIGGDNVMQRWHFDNCPFKPQCLVREAGLEPA